MKIRVLYFDGCPSYEQAVATIREVVAEQKLDADIELIQVSSQEQAAAQRFLGSPTVQVNGVDVEGLAGWRGKPDLNCRLYNEAGALRGWPSRELIRAAFSGRGDGAGVSSQQTCCCLPQEAIK
jgi:hypothetical protein